MILTILFEDDDNYVKSLNTNKIVVLSKIITKFVDNNKFIVKLVNAEAGNWKVRLQLDKAKNLASKGTKIVLGADDRFDENSFSDPLKIVPNVTELSGISNEFTIDCQANSLTVLRIPCEK